MGEERCNRKAQEQRVEDASQALTKHYPSGMDVQLLKLGDQRAKLPEHKTSQCTRREQSRRQ
jgi:hypothetical protein